MRTYEENKIITEQIQNDLEVRTRAVSLDSENMVVMANKMIKGSSKLSLNEKKLLKLIIMQVKPDDAELFEYRVKASELAELIGIPSQHLYSRLDQMTTNIMSEVIKMEMPNSKDWDKFHWVSKCKYRNGIITIKLDDELKPYLIGLKEYYTQIRLNDLTSLKTKQGIDLFELLFMCIGETYKETAYKLVFGSNYKEIYIPMNVLRDATGTSEKYKQGGQFKERIINVAIKDINENSNYHIEAREFKEGHKIVGFYFVVESNAGYIHRKNEEQIEGQMNISDIYDSNGNYKPKIIDMD